MTPEERLESLDKAIQAIMVTGQEYRHEGRMVRRADLAQINAMRDQALSEMAEASGGCTAVAVFEGR